MKILLTLIIASSAFFTGSAQRNVPSTALSAHCAEECSWTVNGNDISYLCGKIGIGLSNPRTKFHMIDTNSRFFIGYQEAYNGPFINLIGEVAGQTPLLGIGLAFSEYNYHGSIVAKSGWGYIYGNDLNEGIAILPNMAYAPKGLYIARDGLVGIGTDEPENALTIEGNEDEWPGRIFLSIKNKSVSGKSMRMRQE